MKAVILDGRLINPFRNGGSSRFLTIAYLVVPNDHIKYCNRLVKNIYEVFKINPSIELKGTSMNDEQKKIAAGKIIRLIREKPDLILGAITVKKGNVKSHIRDDGNKLYNYMIGLSTLPMIKNFPEIHMIRDKRSVKVKSGNSCVEYLNIELAFKLDSATKLIDDPTESHTELNLMFIDWVANFVWSHYEDTKSEPFYRLSEKLSNTELFF